MPPLLLPLPHLCLYLLQCSWDHISVLSLPLSLCLPLSLSLSGLREPRSLSLSLSLSTVALCDFFLFFHFLSLSLSLSLFLCPTLVRLNTKYISLGNITRHSQDNIHQRRRGGLCQLSGFSPTLTLTGVYLSPVLHALCLSVRRPLWTNRRL